MKIRTHVRRPAQNKVIQQRSESTQTTKLELIHREARRRSPVSTHRRCTRCTPTSQCRARPSCRPWPALTAHSVNKQDGLLVGYAPLTENLLTALAEYTARDQNTKPRGKDIDDAVAKVKDMLAVISDEYPVRLRLAHPPRRQGTQVVLERSNRRGELPAEPGHSRQSG